ncbi:MAG: hypothetical protein WC975_00615 [Phycisphaerae bacterium]
MNKPPITHIMLDTSCTNEYLESNVDYCLIPMTLEYVRDILRYMDIVARMYKKDDSIYNIEQWDCHARYLCYNDKMETVQDIRGNHPCDVPGGEPILLTADPEFVETVFTRVECQTIQISNLEVWWTAYVKHTNDRVETMHLPKKVLLEIQQRFKPNENHLA